MAFVEAWKAVLDLRSQEILQTECRRDDAEMTQMCSKDEAASGVDGSAVSDTVREFHLCHDALF